MLLFGFGLSDSDAKRGGESIEYQRIRRPLSFSKRQSFPDDKYQGGLISEPRSVPEFAFLVLSPAVFIQCSKKNRFSST